MKRINLLFSLFLLFFAFPGFAQDEEDEDKDNLVPNASFEKYEDRIRRYDEFNKTTGWYSPNDAISELFVSAEKSRYINVPENMYGKEMPYEGENYAGIVTYSYRGKEPRTYIGVELKKKMADNALYCIKFQASLAERSRYAANNLGVVISSKKITEKGEGSILNKEAITTDKNEVVQTVDGWWEFCKRYNAKGGERYLMIGNFETDERTSTETLELPAAYVEEGPAIAAYYYIDNVEVREIQPSENCGCSNTRIPENKVIYSSTVQLDDDMPVGEKVEAIDAYFYQYKDELTSATERSIDQVVELLKAEPGLKVKVIGHSDDEEVELAEKESVLRTLAKDRAQNVRNYLIAQGIDESRISTESMDNRQPVSKMTTPLSLAKNRRVEFKVVK
jgi:outer membrane protein OmpA-like peptidoglycan-associated protein